MVLILLCGIPASGKSTLALQLADIYSFPVISFDDYETDKTNWDAQSYHETRERALAVFRSHLESIASVGGLVLDDTFHLKSMRRFIYVLCRDQGIELVVIHVATNLETALLRNNDRGETNAVSEQVSLSILP
jgi:tRNA uridine 5-carbamoylmethylation protein Kti12